MPRIDLNSVKLDSAGQDPLDVLLLSSPGYEHLATPQQAKGGPVDLSTIKLDQPEVAQSSDPSFLDRLASNYDHRRNQIRDLANQAVNGDISALEAINRGGLAFASQIPDAAGSAIAALTPDVVKEKLTDAATAIAGTDTGRSAINMVNDFNQNHPIAAGRIGSAFDAANLLVPFAQIGGKSAINATSDALTETAKAVGGGAKRAAGTALRSALPSVDEGLVDVANIARKYEIPLSFDQISSSKAVKNMQKVSQELPFSGQNAFRESQLQAYNKALFKTLGVEADKFTPANMKKAFEKVGGEFDSLTKGKEFRIGEDFINQLAQSADEISSTYGQEASNVFQREAARVIGDFQGDTISGDLIARQRSRINALGRKATPEIRGALLDLENAIVDGITGGDKASQAALTEAKKRYKNLIALEPLAAKAKGGNISPSQLNSRVSRIYGRSHTVGESGEIGDLARVGFELLPELGGSDTAQKLLYTVGAGGGALVNIPATGAALGANRIAQSVLNRNQGLVDRALLRDVMKLPPADAMKLLQGE